MNEAFYLKQFNAAVSKINRQQFSKAGLQLYTGIVLQSVVVKVYKQEWSNDPADALNAAARIFFSVWVNDQTIEEKKLYYNIHAFKLRLLKGYKIPARDFATRFRTAFSKTGQDQWTNCSTRYGPLTLMEGWRELNDAAIQQDIIELLQACLKISPLIDDTLHHYRR